MTKYIKRHDAYMRATHWAFAVGGLILGITGLLLFVPSIGMALGVNTLEMSTLLHRIFAVVFIGVPVICALLRPSNPKHTIEHLFAKWDDDDKEFMKKFVPYLFNPKKVKMPKQHFVKSGQRVADIAMYFTIFLVSISGILLWIGTNALPVWVFNAALFAHDVAFLLFGIQWVMHIFLGGGIFQPYRRIPRGMFGDGYVSESDALYHWGHWAEAELKSGENVVEK